MISAQRLIPAIHARRKQVAGLDDETAWRDFLRRAAGIDSLRAMSMPQLGRVLDALHAAGAPRPAPAAPRLDGQQWLARQLWTDLARAGVMRAAGDRGLDAFVRRLTGVEALAWCRGAALNRVVEALKDRRARELARLAGDLPGTLAVPAGWTREQALVAALWARLREEGRVSPDAELSAWLARFFAGALTPVALDARAAQDAAWQLATWRTRRTRRQ